MIVIFSLRHSSSHTIVNFFDKIRQANRAVIHSCQKHTLGFETSSYHWNDARSVTQMSTIPANNRRDSKISPRIKQTHRKHHICFMISCWIHAFESLNCLPFIYIDLISDNTPAVAPSCIRNRCHASLCRVSIWRWQQSVRWATPWLHTLWQNRVTWTEWLTV